MNPYLIFIIFLLVIEYFLSLIVEFLNLKHFSLEIPQEFDKIYEKDKYVNSQNYMRDNIVLDQIQSIITLILTLVFILLGGFRVLHVLVVSISEFMILQGLVFSGLLIIISIVVNIPFSVYKTFAIEDKYGFNKTSLKTFVLDTLKGLLLAILIGMPVFALILWFFSSISYAWVWSWVSLSAIQLVLMFIAPVVIMPLFNKFTPMKEGELKQKIEKYASTHKFKVKGIFTIDGSKRSTKGNAYFAGFGKTKRIALYDTLIEKHKISELIAILAHEVGHCKLGHIKKSIFINMLMSLLMFFLLSFFIVQKGLYQAFQVEGTPLYAGFIFFFFIYSPISMLLGLIRKKISRKHEFEADAFAAETTNEAEEMINSLKKLSVDNLSNLTPHPLKVALEYSHPPVLERIKALRKKL